MNKFKISTLAAALLFSSIASAEYTMRVPLEVSIGGSLPNGSIAFKSSVVDPVLPTVVDCTEKGLSAECDERLNAWELFAIEKGFATEENIFGLTWNNLTWNTKSLTYIPSEPYPLKSPNQLHLYNGQITNVNGLSNLTSPNRLYLDNNQLTNVDGLSNLTSVNTLDLKRNNITNVNGLRNLKSVNNLIIRENQLTNIDALSSLTSVNNLELEKNNLTNVDGLSNLTSVSGHLSLFNNQLTNVDGLSGLTSVNILDLNTNKLTNVNGLSGLTSVEQLVLYNNKLTNLNGLEGIVNINYLDVRGNDLSNINSISNLKINNVMHFDVYTGVKLAANTVFCTLNSPSLFLNGIHTKNQLCETE